MDTLDRRLQRLEVSSGGKYSRCSEVVSVTVSGEFDSATRAVVPMSEEEYLQNEAADLPLSVPLSTSQTCSNHSDLRLRTSGSGCAGYPPPWLQQGSQQSQISCSDPPAHGRR